MKSLPLALLLLALAASPAAAAEPADAWCDAFFRAHAAEVAALPARPAAGEVMRHRLDNGLSDFTLSAPRALRVRQLKRDHDYYLELSVAEQARFDPREAMANPTSGVLYLRRAIDPVDQPAEALLRWLKRRGGDLFPPSIDHATRAVTYLDRPATELCAVVWYAAPMAYEAHLVRGYFFEHDGRQTSAFYRLPERDIPIWRAAMDAALASLRADEGG